MNSLTGRDGWMIRMIRNTGIKGMSGWKKDGWMSSFGMDEFPYGKG